MYHSKIHVAIYIKKILKGEKEKQEIENNKKLNNEETKDNAKKIHVKYDGYWNSKEDLKLWPI